MSRAGEPLATTRIDVVANTAPAVAQVNAAVAEIKSESANAASSQVASASKEAAEQLRNVETAAAKASSAATSGFSGATSALKGLVGPARQFIGVLSGMVGTIGLITTAAAGAVAALYQLSQYGKKAQDEAAAAIGKSMLDVFKSQVEHENKLAESAAGSLLLDRAKELREEAANISEIHDAAINDMVKGGQSQAARDAASKNYFDRYSELMREANDLELEAKRRTEHQATIAATARIAAEKAAGDKLIRDYKKEKIEADREVAEQAREIMEAQFRDNLASQSALNDALFESAMDRFSSLSGVIRQTRDEARNLFPINEITVQIEQLHSVLEAQQLNQRINGPTYAG